MKITSKFSASMMSLGALVMSLGALTPITTPAYAQAETVDEAQSDAYFGLYDAMRSGVDEEAELDALLGTMADALIKMDPDSRSLEAIYPGAMDAIVDGMRPAFKTYSRRVTAEFKPRLIQILREEMTPEEAIAASEIYNSDIGKKLMSAASTSRAGNAMIAQVLADEDITQSAVSQDIEDASLEAVQSIALKERLQFAASIRKTPSLAGKIAALKPRILALRTEMENAPMTAEEEAMMNSGGETSLFAFIEASDAAYADE